MYIFIFVHGIIIYNEEVHYEYWKIYYVDRIIVMGCEFAHNIIWFLELIFNLKYHRECVQM